MHNRWENRKANPKIILINPPVNYWKLYKWYMFFTSREFPLGLLYIASYLFDNKFSAKIIDAEKVGLKKSLKIISEIEPDIIGVTVTTFSFWTVNGLINKIRKSLPETLIVIGGSHPSALPEESMKLTPELDGCIVGNGEETMLRIVQGEKAESIPGLVWRGNEQKIFSNPIITQYVEHLDNYNLNWSLLDGFPEKYFPSVQSRSRNSTALVVSRGCYYACSFCATNSVHTRKIRQHSPRYVVSMMEYLSSNYKIDDFYFHDDYFAANVHWLKEFCCLLIDKSLNITWSCASRVEPLKKDILILMYQSGCRQIGIGIENGEDEILKSLNKKISTKKLYRNINLIKQNFIDVKGYIIIGNRDETYKSLLKTISFVLSLPLSHIQILYFTPLPGSPVYDSQKVNPKEWKRMNLLNPSKAAGLSFLFLRATEFFIYFSFYSFKLYNYLLKKIEHTNNLPKLPT